MPLLIRYATSQGIGGLDWFHVCGITKIAEHRRVWLNHRYPKRCSTFFFSDLAKDLIDETARTKDMAKKVSSLEQEAEKLIRGLVSIVL